MITLLIDNNPLPPNVQFLRRSLNINQEFQTRAELSLVIVDPTGLFQPAVGQKLDIFEDTELIWSGTVHNPQDTKLAPGITQWAITGADNNALADKRTVNAAFPRQNAGDIVQQIITDVLSQENVTPGIIETGLVIGPVRSPFLPASQLLNEISELIGFTWHINPDLTLDFGEIGFDVGLPIDQNSDLLFSSVKVFRDRNDYRNRQIIAGVNAITSLQVEQPSPTPDGEIRTFILRFPVAQKPTIKVNGDIVPGDQVGILGLDALGSKQWFWNKGQNIVTQDDSQTPLSNVDQLIVQYLGQFPTAVTVDDDAEIADRALIEGNSGIYESVTDGPDLNDQLTAINKGDGLLSKFARIRQKIALSSETINFQPGYQMQVTLPGFNVDGQFLVMSVSISDRGRSDQKLLRTAVLVDGQEVGGWVAFFRNLLQKQRDLTIREDETVLLSFVLQDPDLQQFVDSALQFADATPPFVFHETLPPGNIVMGRWQVLAP